MHRNKRSSDPVGRSSSKPDHRRRQYPPQARSPQACTLPCDQKKPGAAQDQSRSAARVADSFAANLALGGSRRPVRLAVLEPLVALLPVPPASWADAVAHTPTSEIAQRQLPAGHVPLCEPVRAASASTRGLVSA